MSNVREQIRLITSFHFGNDGKGRNEACADEIVRKFNLVGWQSFEDNNLPESQWFNVRDKQGSFLGAAYFISDDYIHVLHSRINDSVSFFINHGYQWLRIPE